MIRISVPSNIDRPSIIIRRSKIYSDVYSSGTVVYSGDKKEFHDDLSITENGHYYYGIEFHNAGVQKVRTIPTGQTFIRDWGPLLPYVKNNIAAHGTPMQAGANGNGVVIFDDGGSAVVPTYTTIYSSIVDIGTAALAEFNTTGSICKVTVATSPSVAGSQKVFAGVLDGKIVSIPAQSASVIRMDGTYARVGSGVAALSAYLDDNPDAPDVIAGGYRWRIRIMDRALLTRFINYFRRIDANTSMALGGFQIGSAASILIHDPDAAARGATVQWTNSGNANEFSESNSTTNVLAHMFIYFEMIGPA